MATKIQLRRDTLSNWTKADPVIMEGEIALVSENADNPVYDRFKIGNGVNKFSELPYAMGQQIEIVQRKGASTEKVMSQKAVTDLLNAGYLFLGIADTDTTPYSSVEVLQNNLFYIAIEKGTYLRFGNKVKKSAASLMVLKSSDSGKTWTAEESTDLSADISDLLKRMSVGKAPVWISVEVDNTVGDVTAYDMGTVIWRKDRKMLCEVVLNEAGRKDVGVDHTIEDDRIYVYGGNLCKWDGTNFIPFYQEKEEKRYLFKLDLIDSLTTATDSETAYQSFIPVGETVYKLPTTGDLLGDEENNIYADILYAHYTEAMDEGGITLSYYKDGVVKTIRITGDDYEFGTWKVAEVTTVKPKYKYNLQKIFALASYSESRDIEEAFTPTYAPDGNTAMRLPQSGDLLEATNGATSVVLKGTSSAFSFFYGDNRRDITLSGSAGNYKVAVVVTPLGVRVFDLDKLNALTDESTPENIEEAFRGNYPTAGDLLEGANESSWVIMSGSEVSTLAKTFTYHTSGKLRTLTVSGDQGNETIKVEEKEVGSDALRITTSNIANIITGGSGSYDLGVTFQQLQDAISNNSLIIGNINGELYAANGSGSSVTLLSVVYLMNNWYSLVMTIPSYTGTTATVTVTAKLLTKFVFVPYATFLSGEIGGTYDNVKMSDLLAANIIQTDKGVATLDTTSGYVLSLIVDGTLYVRCTIDFSDNGGLKLTARTETPIVPKLELDFSSAFDSTDNFIADTEIEGLDKLEEFSNTYGPGNILVKGIPTFRTPAVFCGFDLSTKMREFAVLALHSDTTGNINAGEKTVIRSVHSTIYVFGLKTVNNKTVLGTLRKEFYPIISSSGGETKIYADDISPIVREIAGVYNSSTEITSTSEFSGDQQGTIYLVYSEGTYQLYMKLATVVLPSSSAYKNVLYRITRTGTVTDYPEGTVMYEYEGNVLVPAPKTSYNKIAHLVFDLEVIGENDVTLTLDRLNSYWLESIGSSANLNLRYEGGGAHGMPKLDIIYSKINTDVNNDEALWQKAFTDNNIVLTNCDIPSDQKIITTVDLSTGKAATLTIDFSNVTAMSPFKEDNPKIFVEIYEPVK